MYLLNAYLTAKVFYQLECQLQGLNGVLIFFTRIFNALL